MTVRMPKRSWVLWLIAVLLVLGIVPIVIYSGDLYYAEGGDSIDAPGMLLASIIFILPILLIIWLALVWAFLREYHGGGPIGVWRSPTMLGRAMSLFAHLATAIFVWSILWRVEFWKLSRLPFVVFLLGWAIFFQILRIAAVTREQAKGASGYSLRQPF